MGQNVTGITVIATKQADGSVNFLFQSVAGAVRLFVNLPSADVTNINTNVNGGSAGATRTFTYGQNAAAKANVPYGYSDKD